MTITQEQRSHAWLAGSMFLVKFVLEGFRDGVTIVARSGQGFAEIARFAAENAVFWPFAPLNVGLPWIVISIHGYAIYLVFEPVNERLAQIALVLRLGAGFVGAASLMFRVALARLYKASETEGLFTTDQLRAGVGDTAGRGCRRHDRLDVSRRGLAAGFPVVPAIALRAARTCWLQHRHVCRAARHGCRGLHVSRAPQRVETVRAAIASRRDRDGPSARGQGPPAASKAGRKV